MIILHMMGRAGNQFFQYSFARYIQLKTGQNLCINWEPVTRYHSAEGDGWEDSLKYFNTVDYTSVTEDVLDFRKKLLLHLDDLYFGVSEKLYKCKIIHYIPRMPKWQVQAGAKFGLYYYPHGYYPYDISCQKEIYIKGYFECAKYFDVIKPVLQKELTPKYAVLQHNADFYEQINCSESVCLSIRRGDFFSDKNAYKYGMCDIEYYKRAINFMKQIIPNCKFIVFSDNIEWVKNNMTFLKEEGALFEKGSDPIWEKLRLMYSCKHFIISNSTFSWWGQYLSRNENKIVIAPKIWRRDGNVIDIYEDNWLRV